MPSKPRISAIVAGINPDPSSVAPPDTAITPFARLGIGRANRLPFHIPLDLQYFKHMTSYSTVIMGRKTWDSLPKAFRPLPNRRNIVLSRSNADKVGDGVQVMSDLDEALRECADTCNSAGSRVFVVGGSSVYQALLSRTRDYVVDLYVTHIIPKWSEVPCDTHLGVNGDDLQAVRVQEDYWETDSRACDFPRWAWREVKDKISGQACWLRFEHYRSG